MQVLQWATPCGPSEHRSPWQRIKALLEDESQSLSLAEIEQLLDKVEEKKQYLEEQEKDFNLGLLRRFFLDAKYASHMLTLSFLLFCPWYRVRSVLKRDFVFRDEKERQLVKLQKELDVLEADLRVVNDVEKASTSKLLLPAASPSHGQASHALALPSGVSKALETVSVKEQVVEKGKQPSSSGTTGQGECKRGPGAAASQGVMAYHTTNAYRLWAVKRKVSALSVSGTLRSCSSFFGVFTCRGVSVLLLKRKAGPR